MANPSFVVEPIEQGFLVIPAGRIGGPEGETLSEEFERLSSLKPALIVVDLSKTEMLASRAISALMSLKRLSKESGGTVRLAAVPAPIMSLLKTVRLDDYLPVFMSVADAKR